MNHDRDASEEDASQTGESGASSSREAQLDEILAEYLQDADSAAPPDQQAFIARYPQFAAELREFFASQEQFENAARPFRYTALPGDQDSRWGVADPNAGVRDGDATVGTATLAVAASPGLRIRYFGEYELLEEIARGGMGVVFKARQVRLNRIVALKMILAGQFASAEDVKRFQVEAENAAQLDHPNIVPIYEVGKHKGQHYFTMKLVEGGSLATQGDAFTDDARSAARLLATVARAVHHAHQRGVLHRDLKPGNILLGTDGQPQVTDFGLARQLEGDAGITLSGAVLGSPRYMSPEQARGEKRVTTAADVYGLGAVLYELLTQSAPFRGDTVLETLRMVKETEPRRPSLIGARIDRDLETICLKCLAKDPQARYASAEALSEDLERWLAGETILARRTSLAGRLRRWCRRRPAVAALTVISSVAALLLVAVAVAVPYQQRLRQAVTQTGLALAAEKRALATEEGQRKKVEQAYGDADRAHQAELAQRKIAEEELARSRAFDYLSQIGWAEREYLDNNPARADQILDWCPPELRRWEWHYLKRLCHAEIVTLPGELAAQLVVGAPGGPGFLTIGSDGALRAWGDGGELVDSKFPAIGKATSVAISPNGRSLIAYGETTHVWQRAEDSRWGSARQLHPPTWGVLAFSPDGRWAAAGTIRGTVRVWDTATWECRYELEGHSEPVNGLSFSADGMWLASCSGWQANNNGVAIPEHDGGDIRIWDLQTGKVAQTFGGNTGSIRSVHFAGPRRLASGHSRGSINIWNFTTGSLEATLSGHTGAVLCVSASYDGSMIFDADTGKTVLTLKRAGRLAPVAFSPDGKLVTTSGIEDASLAIPVWEVQSPNRMRTLTLPDKGPHNVFDVAFSPDGRFLAGVGGLFSQNEPRKEGGEVRIWDVDSGLVVRSFAGAVFCPWSVAFSPDGKWLAIGGGLYGGPSPARYKYHGPGGEVRVWEVATGRQVFVADRHDCIFRVVFSPDGSRLVSGGGMGQLPPANELTLTDTLTWRDVITLRGHRGAIEGLAFSRDGRLLASAARDGTVRMWNTPPLTPGTWEGPTTHASAP